jgi:hypothetical protein
VFYSIINMFNIPIRSQDTGGRTQRLLLSTTVSAVVKSMGLQLISIDLKPFSNITRFIHHSAPYGAVSDILRCDRVVVHQKIV